MKRNGEYLPATSIPSEQSRIDRRTLFKRTGTVIVMMATNVPLAALGACSEPPPPATNKYNKGLPTTYEQTQPNTLSQQAELVRNPAITIMNRGINAVRRTKINDENREPDQVTGVITWDNAEAREKGHGLAVATIVLDPRDRTVTATMDKTRTVTQGNGRSTSYIQRVSSVMGLTNKAEVPDLDMIHLSHVINWANQADALAPLEVHSRDNTTENGVQIYYADVRNPNSEVQQVIPLGAPWNAGDRERYDLNAVQSLYNSAFAA